MLDRSNLDKDIRYNSKEYIICWLCIAHPWITPMLDKSTLDKAIRYNGNNVKVITYKVLCMYFLTMDNPHAGRT